MRHPSRYHRPDVPRPFQLTGRDRQVLHHVARHRYLTSDHIHALVFGEVSVRVAQRRLRVLFEHSYLDRFFCPVVLTGAGASARQSPRPLYALARLGARVLRDEGVTLALPCTPESNAQGYATLSHHLVATDLLVALEAACHGRHDIDVVRVEREDELRRQVARFRSQGNLRTFIVSDSAFTVRYPQLGRTWTYHVEVVRALARSGNRTLSEKFAKYATLHHAGYFRRVLGHDLRAVLVVTTTEARAQRYRQLASKLAHGKRLFWFTSYGKGMSGGAPVTVLRHGRILEPIWRTADDEESRSLLSPS